MKRNLRYVLMSALMLVCGSAFAEDIIWHEDWTGYDANVNPQGINADYNFTGSVLNDDGTVKSGTKIYDANLAGGTAPELLVAKGGGTFSAKVHLDGIKGEVTLAYKTNRSDLTVEVEGATLGEKTRTGNDDVYPITVAEGTDLLVITFMMATSSNARLDDIKLYQGTAKKPAGLSWGKASTAFTLGEEVTLTLSNANNLPVTYRSSDETVATISAEGVITLVAAGKTTLTAAFEGNDEYEAQSVSIDVTVKAPQQHHDDNEKGQVNNPYTVAEALAFIATLGDATSDEVYAKGIVTKIVTEWSEEHGNVTFMISDDADATNELEAYRGKSLYNKNFTAADQLAVGDEVVIRGKLVNYSGNTPEFTSGCYLYKTTNSANISGITVDAQQGKVYNLAGQRVAQPVKGLYIVGGKKVLMK